MIAVAITDRLGNQMFQYAAAKGLAVRNGTIVKIDRRYYKRRAPKGFKYELDAFNVPQLFISKKEIKEYTGLSDRLVHKVIRKMYKAHQKKNKNYMYYEPFFHYDEKVESLGDKIYLRGYWQSFKYFEHIQDIIRSEFTFRNPVNKETDLFAKQIINSNSVCVSVRRGADLDLPENRKKFARCNEDYYQNALSILAENEKSLTLFVFSDEIEWCRANLRFDFPTVFVFKKFGTPVYYLQLISMCKYFIIPVSTFPWWGAWLADYEYKKVIAPKQWFKDPNINTNDLCPPDWIRI